MKQNLEDIENERIKLHEQQGILEEKRLGLVNKKKNLTQQLPEIDRMLREHNYELNAIKNKLEDLNTMVKVLNCRFDEKKVERLLYKAKYTLQGIVKRGIGLDKSEEVLIEEIDNLLG